MKKLLVTSTIGLLVVVGFIFTRTYLYPTSMTASVANASNVVSGAGDPQVSAMGNAFVSAVPTDWNTTLGSWKYFDGTTCFASGTTCYGNNPSSPYGFPSFSVSTSSATIDQFKIKQNDAIVIFLKTPPQVRYFGFTQYLMQRGQDPYLYFASLSDTLNLKDFVTTSTSSDVFNKYAVIVWTADMNTLSTIKNILHTQGILDNQINFISLPISFPLNLGNASTSDTFSMLMRTAIPNIQADLDAYMQQKPFFVVKVGPKKSVANSPTPTTGYRDETSGVSEDSAYQTALNALVADIKRNYALTYKFEAQNVNFVQKTGWDCITNPKLYQCNGDNHDALYSVDVLNKVILTGPSDFVIVAGVNHQQTGQALYLNHSVYDVDKFAGIATIDDSLFLTKTALYHAGVKSTNDPRVAQYKNLYAYIISYNCAPFKYCMQIPAPTPDDPIGLPPGTPFYLIGRSYENPKTHVRPSVSEIVPHQVLIGTHR